MALDGDWAWVWGCYGLWGGLASGYASVSVALAGSHTAVPGLRARSATAAAEMSTSAGGVASTWTRTRSASSSSAATVPGQTLRGLACVGRAVRIVIAEGRNTTSTGRVDCPVRAKAPGLSSPHVTVKGPPTSRDTAAVATSSVPV